MQAVLQSLLLTQIRGGLFPRVCVIVCEEEDNSPECDRTPHLMVMVYNHWKVRFLLLPLREILSCPK